MRAWQRPPGYRAFVVLGLLAVVGATVGSAVATADEPGSMLPLYVGVGSVGVFVVLLVAVQWVGTALAARAQGRSSDDPTGPHDPPADLLGALVVDPAAGPPPAEVARAMRRGAMNLQAMVSLLALAVVAGGAAYVLGLDVAWRPFGGTIGFPLAFAPVFAILIYGLYTHRARLRRAFEIGDQFLAPLGLRTVAVPQLMVVPGVGDGTLLRGATVFAGTRHGRRVEVTMAVGAHSVTIEGTFPPFTVSAARDGRLEARDAPPAVSARLAAITPAERWRGVELVASPDALTVRRRGGADARERWPDDLWLAEVCAAAVEGAVRASALAG